MSVKLDGRWTAEEVRALPEVPGLRFECVDGELLVSPGPRLYHQRVVVEMLRLLGGYVARPPRIGEVSLGPGEVGLDEHTLVQPDTFVVPLNDGRRLTNHDECERFLLVVEVLSPSSHRADRVVKRRKYQKTADAYWLVDPPNRCVERWRPDSDQPEVLREKVEWHPAGRDMPLVVDLPALFREAFGEAP